MEAHPTQTGVGATLRLLVGTVSSSAPDPASRFLLSPPSTLESTSDSRRVAKLPKPLTELLAL